MSPTVEIRSARPYAAIRDRIPRDRLAQVAPNHVAAVREWLGTHNATAAGPPFVRYLVVDYTDSTVEVEIGVPLSAPSSAGDGVSTGMLPAGPYAVITHCGAYDDLVLTTRSLLEWGEANGIAWAMEETDRVASWHGRVEHYVTGPAESSTPDDWRTEIAILLAET